MATCTAVVAALTMGSPAGAQTQPAADTKPSAPVLRVVSATDLDIFLEWTQSTGATNYFVFFDDNETPFIVGNHTEFNVHFNRVIGMVPGSTHMFQVRAEDSSGKAALSNVVTATFLPGDNDPPTAPGNLRVVSNTASGVELAWDASIDESEIVNYFLDGATCSPRRISGDATSAFVQSIDTDPVCGLVPGAYTFSVRARDALDNESPLSNTVTVTFPASE